MLVGGFGPSKQFSRVALSFSLVAHQTSAPAQLSRPVCPLSRSNPRLPPVVAGGRPRGRVGQRQAARTTSCGCGHIVAAHAVVARVQAEGDGDSASQQAAGRQATSRSRLLHATCQLPPRHRLCPRDCMVQVFSRITADSLHRAIHASNLYSLSFRHKGFFCWRPTYQYLSTSNPMRPNDLLELEAQNPVPAEGNDSCSSSVQFTPEIEKKYVHRVYDAIAPHFSATRFAKWPKVAGFLNSLRAGSIVLDAGCGNGKYLGFNSDCFFIGCDISPPLVEICSGRGHEVLVGDAVNLPYRDDFGDAAISIAVLHHLSTDDRWRKAIEELIRVVRRGGLVLITVWAREQEDKSLLNKWTPLCEKYNEEWVDQSSPPVRSQSTSLLESIAETDEDAGVVTNDYSKKRHGGVEDKTVTEHSNSNADENEKNQQEYFVPWHLPFHRAEIGGASAAALENGFAKKDEKKGTVVYNRYYHVFVEGELQRLVSGIKNASIVDQFYDKSNWCIVLEKL